MNWNYDFYMASSVVLMVLIIYYYRVAELGKLSRRIYGYFLIICDGYVCKPCAYQAFSRDDSA